MSKERVNFGSKLGMVLATAGSAVGLGNVWRFPYMTGQNGGAVFIMVYIGCVVLLGLPCMMSEQPTPDALTARWAHIACGALWAV